MEIQVGMLVSSWGGSVEVEIMAPTSRASPKRVEDAEIFQVLEEITDSNITIFSSEEDEDGNEPDSDEMDNWMTIVKQMKMKALVLAAQKLLI
jgi:hypothetical protein